MVSYFKTAATNDRRCYVDDGVAGNGRMGEKLERHRPRLVSCWKAHF